MAQAIFLNRTLINIYFDPIQIYIAQNHNASFTGKKFVFKLQLSIKRRKRTEDQAQTQVSL